MDDGELHADLEAFMGGDEDGGGHEAVETPADADEAEKLLRARARLMAEDARLVEFAERQIAEIAAWRDDRVSGLRRRVADIEWVLEQWMRAVNRDDPKRKSVSLPHGTPKLRSAGQYTATVTDEEALLEWCEETDPAGLVKRTPRLAEVKARTTAGPTTGLLGDLLSLAVFAAVTADGEVVPGLVLTKPIEDTFKIDGPK